MRDQVPAATEMINLVLFITEEMSFSTDAITWGLTARMITAQTQSEQITKWRRSCRGNTHGLRT